MKPEILEKARTAELADDAWRLFVSMILLADDYGNLDGHPRRLQGAVFWARELSRPITEILGDVERAELVRPYAVRGQPFIAIVGWAEHQKVLHPGKPRVPSPEGLLNVSRDSQEGFLPDLRSGSGSTTTINDHDHESAKQASLTLGAPALDFDAVYALYPRKLGRKRAAQRFNAQITTPEKYAALMRAVKNYAASVEGTDPKYVKHFDSFMSCWEDYTDAAPPANGAPRRPGGFMPPRGAVDVGGEEKL